MTAELLAAADAGRARIAIGRASDFFGPGVTAGSTLGERVFGNALAGRRADFIGNPGLPHTYSYVPDIAAGLATLGTDARAVGQVWHLPGPATGTTRALLDLLLWLDHLVHIPRYRVVGWALTAGPVILVITMSGSSLAVTTGLAAGITLLGTAAAGFHDLAAIRAARPPDPASPSTKG
jgi:hypothetical protein